MGNYTTNNKWYILTALFVLCISAMSFWPGAEDEVPDMPKVVEFSYHIQPILSQNCYTCHGNDPGTRKAGLRLDIKEGATSLLESGHKAISPKSLSRSELVERIMSDDPKLVMPPPEAKKSLTKREIALLKKWIKQGAKYEKHWAFVPPEKKSLESQVGISPNDIDDYINKKLKQKRLNPNKKASKNELIRRVSYILTGLPPSIEELDQFLVDESTDAYEHMLDRYLSSSSYGERWARHWMDLVRYGESMGHEMDFNISHSYEYRDYLIRAFNQDVSYDQIVREHLAGDLIENPRVNPEKGFNESHMGTAYYFLGDGKHSPVDPKLEEADKIDNMIDVTSKTFQALTVACAKCHDHKFDPIPTKDYYSMYGIFESSRLIRRPGRLALNQEEKIDSIRELQKSMVEEIKSFIADREGQEYYEVNEEPSINILNSDTSAVVLADFRQGDWEGWYIDGFAFGDRPVEGSVAFENGKVKNSTNGDKKNDTGIVKVLNGFASSRAIASGMQGNLHSPNFILKHDSIAVRARGLNGTLRLVLDNFQVIQDPLWGGCEVKVNSKDWKTYKMSADLAIGHKAYLEFFSGSYKRHVFDIGSEDFVEIQWAVAYSGEHPISKSLLAGQNESLVASEISHPQSLIPKDTRDSYHKLKSELFDSTHFIGMTQGEKIESSVFLRGSHLTPSEDKVPHHFLSVVDTSKENFSRPEYSRMAWADGLLDEDNPLTSRVMVNRIWHHLFGKGIVETVDNFGLQGKLPSHPEVLDYLALGFMKDKWSIKNLIKQIMLTEAFQRSTTVMQENKSIDPDNILLYAFPVRRLEAEAIRDGILAVSGCLDPLMYGEGVPVYLSEFMTGRGRPGVSGPIDSYGRRSIYRTVRRNFIPEMMLTFDMPIPFSTFGNRNTTNVPSQSLMMMNDPFVHEQSYYWAEHLLAKGLDTRSNIEELYKQAFSRVPTNKEIDQGIEFLKLQASEEGKVLEEMKNDPMLWSKYCHSILNFKEFIHLI